MKHSKYNIKHAVIFSFILYKHVCAGGPIVDILSVGQGSCAMIHDRNTLVVFDCGSQTSAPRKYLNAPIFPLVTLNTKSNSQTTYTATAAATAAAASLSDETPDSSRESSQTRSEPSGDASTPGMTKPVSALKEYLEVKKSLNEEKEKIKNIIFVISHPDADHIKDLSTIVKAFTHNLAPSTFAPNITAILGGNWFAQESESEEADAAKDKAPGTNAANVKEKI